MPEYVVFDVETTGRAFNRSDRIIEIATVRLDDDFEIIETWDTLINPNRDVGPTDIHGIHAGDVISAPTFEDLQGDIWHRFEGAIPVAHNLRFDLGFLCAEYERCGHHLENIPDGVCTLSAMRLIDIGSRPTLLNCCQFFGLDIETPHSAKDDALACSQLLESLVKKCELEFPTDHLSNADLWRMPATPLGITRRQADRPANKSAIAEIISCANDNVTNIVDSLPDRSNEYLELLGRSIEDRHIDDEESKELLALANNIGLNAEQQAELHKKYLVEVANILKADGVISEAELYDFSLVAKILGFEESHAEDILTAATGSSEMSLVEDLSGKSVCFTGTSQVIYEGRPLSKQIAEILVQEFDMSYAKSVTKKLDILVVSDPDSLSGKAKKARSYGTRIIAERAFWPKLGIQVD